MKLIRTEIETPALWQRIQGSRLVSSELARVEVLRAVRSRGEDDRVAARAVLDSIDLIQIDATILDTAEVLDPAILRTLDAIHVASALAVGSDLEVLIAYDDRLIEAAAIAGLLTESPGRP